MPIFPTYFRRVPRETLEDHAAIKDALVRQRFGQARLPITMLAEGASALVPRKRELENGFSHQERSLAGLEAMHAFFLIPRGFASQVRELILGVHKSGMTNTAFLTGQNLSDYLERNPGARGMLTGNIFAQAGTGGLPGVSRSSTHELALLICAPRLDRMPAQPSRPLASRLGTAARTLPSQGLWGFAGGQLFHRL